MKASELIVRCLENEGVRHIFGVPGEENMDLLDALLGSSIHFVTTRHEQGAAFMADVYGRLTGKAGVCLSTLGPGATNLGTGVPPANMDRPPLVAPTGTAGPHRAAAPGFSLQRKTLFDARVPCATGMAVIDKHHRPRRVPSFGDFAGGANQVFAVIETINRGNHAAAYRHGVGAARDVQLEVHRAA